MSFTVPVDAPVRVGYGEKGRGYTWSRDPDNGFWIPIKGPYGFGEHRGVDFDCEPGSVVRAMADGVIVRSRYESALDGRFGAGLYILQLVILPGFDSWVLRYSHLKASYVTPSQRVVRGEPIAESGNTGEVTRPYLHVDLMDLRRQWRDISFGAP